MKKFKKIYTLLLAAGVAFTSVSVSYTHLTLPTKA